MEYLYKDHELNVDLWQSKRSLFEAFYGAFYDFILTKKGGKEDLESHNIHSKEDFYAYADFYADGRDSCYAMGFGFYQYFSETMMDGSLDKLTDYDEEKIVFKYIKDHSEELLEVWEKY